MSVHKTMDFLQEPVVKQKCITVLDQRRANNILIEIKRMPKAHHIRSAILNMDSSIFTKEIVDVSVSSLGFHFAMLFTSETTVDIDAY